MVFDGELVDNWIIIFEFVVLDLCFVYIFVDGVWCIELGEIEV